MFQSAICHPCGAALCVRYVCVCVRSVSWIGWGVASPYVFFNLVSPPCSLWYVSRRNVCFFFNWDRMWEEGVQGSGVNVLMGRVMGEIRVKKIEIKGLANDRKRGAERNEELGKEGGWDKLEEVMGGSQFSAACRMYIFSLTVKMCFTICTFIFFAFIKHFYPKTCKPWVTNRLPYIHFG